ncbi:YitT family protein [Merdibacter massiliensis]|uniref:YitT family protein n=1 Tax=Merdibacter massiliensis TaxID=1871030 RepID=UPI00096A7C2A|nr:YitT family protein [Merdibacter massiliensis]
MISIHWYEQVKKNKKVRIVLSLIMIACSSLLQTYVIQSFINPANLLSAGFTGVAILLDRIANLCGWYFPTSIGILILNVPVALACYRSVGKRFTLYSSIQFCLTSFLLGFVHFEPILNDVILNVAFGGFLNGMAITLALKANGSTGGTDFISLYVSNKIHKSIWNEIFMFNVCILAIFGAIFGWEYAGYSIVFQFISTRTISTFHHRYEQITIEATTQHPEHLSEEYLTHFHHGMTVLEGYGAYLHKRVYVCKTVVSSYEAHDVVMCLRNADPNVIINTYRTNNFYGRFYQKPIDDM